MTDTETPSDAEVAAGPATADMEPRDGLPLMLADPITLSAVWTGSRWAYWKASLNYTNEYPTFADAPHLSGRLVAEHHADPNHAVDALTAAADLLGINLTYLPPELRFHAYSTDGLAVYFPGWQKLLRGIACSRGWIPLVKGRDSPSGR
jgi:hypothetical protein